MRVAAAHTRVGTERQRAELLIMATGERVWLG
jgi:hypothetical protein